MTHRLILRLLATLALAAGLFIHTYTAVAAPQNGNTPAPQLLKEAAANYARKDYAGAARLYSQLLDSQQEAISNDEVDHQTLADIHFNLGNCHYRLKNLPQAVLHFQRALRYQPGDEDAAFNLELVQSKLSDRFETPSEMFFISWARTFIHSRSAASWLFISFMTLLFALVFALVYFFASAIRMRKIGFFAAALLLLTSIISGTFSAIQRKAFNDCPQMVVMKATTAYSTPATTSRQIRQLHEGTTVSKVNDNGAKWLQVEMPDGAVAWITADAVQAVRP